MIRWQNILPHRTTPAAGNNTTQLATTAFVQAALTTLINGAPATLDTLKEIAAAINNDPKFSTTINNALALKAPLSSPALTGTPTAPTAAQSVNNTQIATTAFVKSAIAAMVGSAPAALDTLNELAAALGNDPNFATTMLNALAGKQPLDNTLTNLSGKDVAGLLTYLGLGEGAPAIGVPFFWPSAAMPDTVIDSWSGMVFLKFNGAKFSATDYPVLAKVFPALALPDARGDFIRIWDDGRGIDVGRTLLSGQSHTIMDHAHNMELWTGDGLAAGSAREGVNPGILATYGDGGIVKTDEPGLKVPSSLRALSSRSVKRYGEISGNVGTETRPRNIAFNFLVRAK